MTEEGQASSSISVLHSMLNRLKSSERLPGSSHVTDQHWRHSKDTKQCYSVFIPESDRPEWNASDCSVKPEEQNNADGYSVHFTQSGNSQESRLTSTIFLKSGPQSNLLHNTIRDTRQDLQSSESNPSGEEVKDEQTSLAESHFSILKNSPPHGPFANDPTGSSLTNSEPRFVQKPTVPMEHEIMNQPWRIGNTVTPVEEGEPPPLPHKPWNFNKVHVPLQRTFTLKDFKLDLEPINLLEEICTGDEWAKFLPVKDSPPQTDAIDYSQTEDSNDDIGFQNAVLKPDLSADNELSVIGSSPASVTDSQVDRVIQVRQGTSDSPISALPKTPIRNVPVTYRMSAMPEYEHFKRDENDLVVVYVHDKNDLTKVKDMPLDLSVVKSSNVLDNSALKSRIQLNKKRKHRPPGKRKKGNTMLGFIRQQSTSTESSDFPTSSNVSVFSSSKFDSLPPLEPNDPQTHKDSQTAVLANEKALVRNAAVSEVPESYSNDNDIKYKNYQLSNKESWKGVPLDFSVVKSSGVLDNSALKNRIQLSKKRKHRPPKKRKNENGKKKFSAINIFHHNNASKESVQSRPSSCSSAFTSSTFSQTSVPTNEQKAKDRFFKPKLWKMKT